MFFVSFFFFAYITVEKSGVTFFSLINN